MKTIMSFLAGTLLTCSVAGAQATFAVCEAAASDKEQPVFQGRDGYLFVEYDLEESFNPESVEPYLRRLAQAFAARGMVLVAVPVPRRAMVDSAYLDPSQPALAAYSPERAVAGYREVVDLLNKVGIIAPDVVEFATRHADTDPYFLKGDLHWAPTGAQLTAQAVAEAVSQLPQYQGLEQQTFVTEQVGVETQTGSWQKVIEKQCGTELPEEEVAQYVTQSLSGDSGLFGDVGEPRVVLLGDSNSQRPAGQPSFNFDGFLRESLSTDVLNVAVNGGGAFTALMDYFSSEDFERDSPVIAVWEFRNWSMGKKYIPDYRQATASVYGSCGGSELTVTTVSLAETIGVFDDLGALDAQGSDYYLHLTTSDPTLTELELTLKYEGGNTEVVELTTSTRASGRGDFFLELSDEIVAPLSQGSIKLSEKHEGSLKIHLCRI